MTTAENTDKCGMRIEGKDCLGRPSFTISGLLPNKEEMVVCQKCHGKLLRKKSRTFNFVAKPIKG